MKKLGSLGLSVEITGDLIKRQMVTIRFDGEYVASCCFCIIYRRDNIKKGEFWTHFLIRDELSFEQVLAVDDYLKQKSAQYKKIISGSQ